MREIRVSEQGDYAFCLSQSADDSVEREEVATEGTTKSGPFIEIERIEEQRTAACGANHRLRCDFASITKHKNVSTVGTKPSSEHTLCRSMEAAVALSCN